MWQCNDKFKGDCKCTTPHFYEDEIKGMFLRAFGKMTSAKDSIIEDCHLMQETLSDCTDLDKERSTILEDMELTEILIRKCIDENTLKVQNQEEYLERYQELTSKYEKQKKKIDSIERERQRRTEQKSTLQAFIDTFKNQETPPLDFDEELWLTIVERVTVNADGAIVFRFRGGIEIIEQM